MAYVRTVRTASGATAVQIVYSSRRGSRRIEHIGSAHDDAQLEASKIAARQRLALGQDQLDLGLESGVGSGGALPITSSRVGHLCAALVRAYDALGFEAAKGSPHVRGQTKSLLFHKARATTDHLINRDADKARRAAIGPGIHAERAALADHLSGAPGDMARRDRCAGAGRVPTARSAACPARRSCHPGGLVPRAP